jgi:hypothetical protein
MAGLRYTIPAAKPSMSLPSRPALFVAPGMSNDEAVWCPQAVAGVMRSWLAGIAPEALRGRAAVC